MAVASRLQWLTANDGMPRGLWPIEWLAVSYSGITSLYLGVLWPQMDHPLGMLADRAYILAATLLVWGIYTLWPCRWMTFVRITAQMSLLCYWYPDTYEFNSTLPNLDHFFARCDAFLFGCQPAMEFHRSCPWPWFSEAVHMGYFSYYPMIVTVMVFFFLYRNKSYEKASFVVLCSFFLYYLVYLVLPVAGPQFYFWAVSPDLIATGQYPPLGTYFNLHTDMLPSPGNPAGLFHRLVEQAQEMGERPTAAFPSSHIGITLILLLMVYPQSRRLFYILLPFSVLLAMATVYIQAHYLVDAIAGVLTAYPVYRLSQWIFQKAVPNR